MKDIEIAPSQVQHPVVTVLRTVAQIVVSLLSAGIIGLLTLAAAAPELLAAVQEILPEESYAWLAGFLAVVVAIAGTLTRIFAIPSVNEFLRKIGLGVPGITIPDSSEIEE